MRTLWNRIGARLFGLWYRIDITNACALSCPACARAKFDTPKGIMSLETFKKVIDKALSEGKIRSLELYAWGDPLLHPDLHLFCEYAVSRGIKGVKISSTFTTIKCDMEKVLLSGIDRVFVSFSGWDNYHLTHRGGNLEKSLVNFEKLSKMPKHPKTQIKMRFHVYTINTHETERARALAEGYGWTFHPYEAQWMENASIIKNEWTAEDKKMWEIIPWKPAMKKVSEFCYYQSKAVLMDSNANAYLCCAAPYAPEFQTGTFLQEPLSVIRKRMFDHSFCTGCKNAGLNTYQMGRGGA